MLSAVTVGMYGMHVWVHQGDVCCKKQHTAAFLAQILRLLRVAAPLLPPTLLACMGLCLAGMSQEWQFRTGSWCMVYLGQAACGSSSIRTPQLEDLQHPCMVCLRRPTKCMSRQSCWNMALGLVACSMQHKICELHRCQGVCRRYNTYAYVVAWWKGWLPVQFAVGLACKGLYIRSMPAISRQCCWWACDLSLLCICGCTPWWQWHVDTLGGRVACPSSKGGMVVLWASVAVSG